MREGPTGSDGVRRGARAGGGGGGSSGVGRDRIQNAVRCGGSGSSGGGGDDGVSLWKRSHPCGNSFIEYEVKWLGFPRSKATWEPRAALEERCGDLLEAYDKEHNVAPPTDGPLQPQGDELEETRRWLATHFGRQVVAQTWTSNCTGRKGECARRWSSRGGG